MLDLDPHTCFGSGRPPGDPAAADEETGECSFCGGKFLLGYGGLIPVHDPVAPGEE
jgi:hypothetical protein